MDSVPMTASIVCILELPILGLLLLVLLLPPDATRGAVFAAWR